jgi:hypothetical protein
MSELEHLVEQVDRLERRAEKLRRRLNALATEDALRRKSTFVWSRRFGPFTLGLVVGILSVPMAGITLVVFALILMGGMRSY